MTGRIPKELSALAGVRCLEVNDQRPARGFWRADICGSSGPVCASLIVEPVTGVLARFRVELEHLVLVALVVNPGCGPKRNPAVFAFVIGSVTRAGEAPREDKIEVHRKGPADAGFPVSLTTKQTVPRPNGEPFVSESVQEVIELSNAPLGPALFEVPDGYKQVDRLQDYIAPGPTAGRPPAESPWDALKRYWASLFR